MGHIRWNLARLRSHLETLSSRLVYNQKKKKEKEKEKEGKGKKKKGRKEEEEEEGEVGRERDYM